MCWPTFRLIWLHPKNKDHFEISWFFAESWSRVMTLKLTVPAYWTTIIKFLIFLDDFYFSSVQLSVKYHSLSLSQCHIQIIKSGDWRTERKFWWWGPRKKLHRAVTTFSWSLLGAFLGFCIEVTVSWFFVDFIQNKDLNSRFLSHSNKNHKKRNEILK